jgi:hypothetical protein
MGGVQFAAMTFTSPDLTGGHKCRPDVEHLRLLLRGVIAQSRSPLDIVQVTLQEYVLKAIQSSTGRENADAPDRGRSGVCGNRRKPVSRSVAALERDVGGKLIRRTRRRLNPPMVCCAAERRGTRTA